MSSQRFVRTVLMGDPKFFSVKGGANPHTRTRWGTRRRVDRQKAIEQWHTLYHVLEDLGVRILVIPPDRKQPGLVYPANAGFLSDVDEETPHDEKIFTLSNLLPTRAGEKPHYQKILRKAGFTTRTLRKKFRFEGEADFFPVGDVVLLTHGQIEQQRFVPSLSIPPWRRIYGFRTDARVEQLFAPIVAPRRILRLELLLEAHYHGDTALCAFGRGRKNLLAYRQAITPGGWDRLREQIGDKNMIELEEDDATLYAANSFTLMENDASYLVMPEGVSERLQDQIREHGTTPITVNVSEFLKKGGGSVKCMIGDLGPVAVEGSA